MNSSPNELSESAKSNQSSQSQESELAGKPPDTASQPQSPELAEKPSDLPEEPAESPPIAEIDGPEEQPPGEPEESSNSFEDEPKPTDPSQGSQGESNPTVSLEEGQENEEDLEAWPNHPISPPSEPRQYRAIGLVKARYVPSDQQFTKGDLIPPDGAEINAVLLGRIMSLVKNHLNLEENHLWVVYPRTRQKEGNLHAQIMGVWEPENLNQLKEPTPTPGEVTDESQPDPEPGPSGKESDPSDKESEKTAIAAMPLEDGYFSIRGEVVFQSQDRGYLIVKIKQSARKSSDKPKFFKLKLSGTLEGKAVGHFWDFHVRREGNDLVVMQGNDMGMLPSRRKPMRKGKRGSYSKSRPPKKPYSPSGRPEGFKPSPPKRKESRTGSEG
ncbi:MAG: hypothetical protein F6J93_20575 [Oscillatoria sp. SIO1A7]|nr:hypothetical protein [Oscillatoria sp. SIO1A7]